MVQDGGKIGEIESILMEQPIPFVSMKTNPRPIQAWAMYGPLKLDKILELNKLPSPLFHQFTSDKIIMPEYTFHTDKYSYTGEIKNQMPHGIGRMVKNGNAVIEGMFQEGLANGWCRFFNKDG